MIFVTVGAQMPFDRLIRTVDEWAGRRGRRDVFAQIGQSDYAPQHLQWARSMSPLKFRATVEQASVIVAHAGMGSIITALELGKPIIVMPRRGELNETRNDHQVATAKQFLAQGRVLVASDETELARLLDEVEHLYPTKRAAGRASPRLLRTLREFIDTGAVAGNGGRTFDGVICFGGLDWWYHNRGHYDIQMVRQLSHRVPALYVNSIGMRVPKLGEGRMFFRRVFRKLKSLRRGLSPVGPDLSVFSPVTLPGSRSALHQSWVSWQVRRAASKMGIHSPLIWVACPTAAEAARRIPRAGLVYQRTDRYEAFPGVDPDYVRGCDRRLKTDADVTLFCSSLLYGREAAECRRPAFIDHGVDYERFCGASDRPAEPADVRCLPRPRVGFVGSIDAHTFAPQLLVQVASALPEFAFVLVGACSLPNGWCRLPNVHLLGQRPYEQVADYMAACDVLIMPWNDSEWIRACNPVKLKEYLAVGRPVVTTPFVEAARYGAMITQAVSVEEFVAAIRRAAEQPGDSAFRREAVSGETWAAKAAAVVKELESVEVRPGRDGACFDESRDAAAREEDQVAGGNEVAEVLAQPVAS